MTDGMDGSKIRDTIFWWVGGRGVWIEEEGRSHPLRGRGREDDRKAGLAARLTASPILPGSAAGSGRESPAIGKYPFLPLPSVLRVRHVWIPLGGSLHVLFSHRRAWTLVYCLLWVHCKPWRRKARQKLPLNNNIVLLRNPYIIPYCM